MKPEDLIKHRRGEDNAKVVCVGVPWDTHSTYERGAAKAPEIIARLIFMMRRTAGQKWELI